MPWRKVGLWARNNGWGLAVYFMGICALLLALYLAKTDNNPPAGTYIAIMGAFGVFAAFREEPTLMRFEKSAWVFLLTVLLVAEVQNLYHVDKKQTETFKGISDSLRLTREGLEETRKGLGAAAQKLEGLSSSINEATDKSQQQFSTMMSEMTGGNSYIYMEPLQILGPIEVQLPGFTRRPVMQATTVPKFVGTYPLQNVRVSILDPLGSSDVRYGTMYPGTIGEPVASPVLRIRPEYKRQHTGIFINCSNGTYLQLVLFINLDGKWVWASRLYKGADKNKRLIREWADPSFPKDRLSDWDKNDDKK